MRGGGGKRERWTGLCLSIRRVGGKGRGEGLCLQDCSLFGASWRRRTRAVQRDDGAARTVYISHAPAGGGGGRWGHAGVGGGGEGGEGEGGGGCFYEGADDDFGAKCFDCDPSVVSAIK